MIWFQLYGGFSLLSFAHCPAIYCLILHLLVSWYLDRNVLCKLVFFFFSHCNYSYRSCQLRKMVWGNEWYNNHRREKGVIFLLWLHCPLLLFFMIFYCKAPWYFYCVFVVSKMVNYSHCYCSYIVLYNLASRPSSITFKVITFIAPYSYSIKM